MKMKILLVGPILAIIFFHVNYAQDIAQWRGPFRNGIYPDKGLLKSWPVNGPVMQWSASGVGTGHSSVVVYDNQVYVTGMKDGTDYLTAFSLNGKQLWQIPFGPSWWQSFPETRCTPTIENDQIYLVSGNGTVGCYSTKDGTTLWQFDGVKRYDGKYGEWGVCESLLVLDEKLYFTPGGPNTTVVALDKNTGQTIWSSESLDDTAAYVSPLLVHWGNNRIVFTLLSNYMVGVNADNGEILCKFNYANLSPEDGLKVWPGAPKTNTITPLFRDGYLYITGGYNHVGVMFKLSDDGRILQQVWTDTTLDCHHGGVVEVDGVIYGSNWFDNSRGNWCSVDWQTGKVNYSQKWFTKGAIIAAGEMLYCYEEKTGHVALVKTDPSKFEVVSTFQVPLGKGPHWSHPSIYDGILYIRHGDAVMAYNIRAQK